MKTSGRLTLYPLSVVSPTERDLPRRPTRPDRLRALKRGSRSPRKGAHVTNTSRVLAGECPGDGDRVGPAFAGMASVTLDVSSEHSPSSDHFSLFAFAGIRRCLNGWQLPECADQATRTPGN